MVSQTGTGGLPFRIALGDWHPFSVSLSDALFSLHLLYRLARNRDLTLGGIVELPAIIQGPPLLPFVKAYNTIYAHHCAVTIALWLLDGLPT